VWLIDAQGYDYREAAAVLGVPEGTVASRLARARGRLRAILAEERSS
jgi:RNA polymerase sigma-70 factor (ECF subfamily)